jgi:HlyD family secretion protein
MKRAWPNLQLLAVVGVLAGLLAYGFWPRPVSVDTVQVEQGALSVTVDDDGETRIREKYIVSAPVTGHLLRLQLHPGDLVVQSETEVAKILPADPSLLDARTLAESEARKRAAEAAKEQANSVLDSAIELAELAEHHFERAKKLSVSNSISASELEEAEHKAGQAKANVRSAEFNSRVRAFELEQAVAALTQSAGGSLNDRTAAMTMVAPTFGRVLRVFREDAGVVNVGTQLLEIGDVQDLEMVLDILSTDAVRINPGDKIFIDHWGGSRTLNGIVRRIEPAAFLKVSALGVEEKRVNVIGDFIDPWEVRKSIGDGFRIEARIVVETTSPDSLKVASGSLFRHGETWHVYRVQNARAELVQVTIGASNGLETEIIKGLERGDRVLLHPTDQVRNGIRVREQARK